jgi:hypothetical protein
MTDPSASAPAPQTQSPTSLALPQRPLATVEDLEQAVQRQAEPLLQRVKQMTLEVIDEVARKHGNPLAAELRKVLLETVGSVLRTEAAALVDRLRPALLDGGTAMRQNADTLLKDLDQVLRSTVGEVFQDHVPAYSRWAGQRVIDYFLAGTLFCLAAVLLCVGGILGLQQAGLPSFVTYLVGGGVALGVGVFLLRLRSRHWGSTAAGPRPGGL